MASQRRDLGRTLTNLHRALEELESALLEFEEALFDEEPDRLQGGDRSWDLLSIPALCQEIGMSKSWVYEQLKSGEIPSLKLGNKIKVKRKDLEEYLDKQGYKTPDA